VTPALIVVTGLPGTGKSTVAEAVARETGAPAFAGDWLFGALAPHRILHGLERKRSLAVYFDLLTVLARRQLMFGQSAILDCAVSADVAARWQALADEYGARLCLVECVCSDVDLHRSRVVGRVRGIPGWHEIDWEHVERMRTEFPSLDAAALRLDGVDPLRSNLAAVYDLIGHRAG
jgi:predicted kinase